MKEFLISITFLLLIQLSCSGQKFFNYSDTVFEIGQIRRIVVMYVMSGGGSPRIESVPVMDSICYFLKKNKNLVIEIGNHTDYTGHSYDNEELSERRAIHIVDYLIEKGIDKSRLHYSGYGESNPIIVNDDIRIQYPFLENGQKLTEEYIKEIKDDKDQEIANMLNRRTEIKIIKTNRP